MILKKGLKAMFANIIAIIASAALLLGSTFAWFTDVEASNGNVIASGLLNVKAYWMEGDKDPTADEWTTFENGPVFNYDNWEPGYISAKHIKIANEGSLAFKYKLLIAPNGRVSALADVIDVYYLPQAKQITRQDLSLMQPICTLSELISDPDGAAYGVLLPEGATPNSESEAVGSVGVTIALKMKENLGNEYQGLSIGNDFALKIYATQYSYESDSFGKDYDENAEYPPIPDAWDGTASIAWYTENPEATTFTLGSAEDLAGLAALVDGTAEIPADAQITLPISFEGKTVLLDKDVDLYLKGENGEPVSFDPIGNNRNKQAFTGIFDGQGHTINNLYQSGWALKNGYYEANDTGLGLFSRVENATVKNVNVDNANIPSEFNLMGVIAGNAYGDCVFEDIKVTNSYLGNHSYYSGGIVGWASGNHQYINCDIDETNVISSQWGDFNNANGGLVGGISTNGTYSFKDCDVACVIDAYNDVTSAYEWYAYRNVGMLIGRTGQTVEIEGTTYAYAPNVTCENVTVTYGTWANYHYCQFSAMNYPWVRVEAGKSCHAYGNARYDYAVDANGNNVVDENHVHNEGEKHNELLVFDQLYGGVEGGVYGTTTHEGVKVIYNNK